MLASSSNHTALHTTPLLSSPATGAELTHQANIGAEVRLLRRALRARRTAWDVLTAGLFVAPVAAAAVAAR